MNRSATLSFWPIVFGLTMVLAGCETLSTHPFSGSAAMRIDVEVYKGPLSEEPEIQWGNLWGLFDQTERWLIESNNLTRAVFANKGFQDLRHDSPAQWPLPRIGNDGWTVPSNRPEGEKSEIQKWKPSEPLSIHHATDVDKACYKVQAESPWYYFKFWRVFGLLDTIDHYDCFALVTLIKDLDLALLRARSLKEQYHHLRQPTSQLTELPIRDFLQDLGALSSGLKQLAFRWSQAAVAGHSLDMRIRLVHANAIVTTAESANQLTARADALLKQLSPNGLDRRELSPGVALRESEATDFMHIYDWLNADSDIANWFAGLGSADQRVKAVARLFADHHWDKTNTVYASGRGKVAMAFIKDDVGNWSLKSFDNSPEELLNAYANFAKKAVEEAAKLAANAMIPGGPKSIETATKLLDLATATAFSRTTPDSATKDSNTFTPLRHSLLLQLEDMNTHCSNGGGSEEARLKECLNELHGLVKEHGTIVDRIATGMLSLSNIQSRSRNSKMVAPDPPDSRKTEGKGIQTPDGSKTSGSAAPKVESNEGATQGNIQTDVGSPKLDSEF